MNITLFSGFSKRRNSTKQPSGGTPFSVVLKDNTSLMRPSFLLSSVDWSWNYAQWGSNYYYVTDIVQESNNTFRVECALDEMATFKTAIGNYTTLISRSSATENFKVIDTLYPAKASPTTVDTPYGATTVFTDNISNGCYVMATVGNTGNHFYVMTQTRFNSVCYWMFPALGMDYGQWALMSATQALAGGQDNILKNIVSLKWLPIDYSLVSSYLTATADTHIGNWTMPHANAELVGDTNIPISSLDMVFGDRADQGARGEWLYQAPFANYAVYVPPFGRIEVSGENLKKAGLTVVANIAVNVISGNCTLRLYYKNGAMIGVYNTNIACDMASGGTTYNYGGVASAVAGAVSAYAQNNTAGVVGGIASAVVSAIPSGTQIGGGISGVAPDISVPKRTYAVYFDPIDENKAELGRPLAEVRQISTIAGYIKCADAQLALAGHEEEMTKVNSILNSGFFYE